MDDKKYYIFDMDGTLLDTMGYWRGLAAEYFQLKYSIEIPNELTESLLDANTDVAVAKIKERYSIECDDRQAKTEMLALLRTHYEKSAPKKNGLEAFLKKSKENGVKMCVASATPTETVKIALKNAGIDGYFEFVLTTYDVGMGKSSPKIYLECINKLGAKKDEAAIFEDAAYAIKTAKKEGFYVVGVEDYYSRAFKDEIMSLSDAYITDYAELVK